MSRFYGPRIVTDGLVLMLDAGNTKSYPKTGNTWYDLSGNNKHATLINTPTYTAGYLSFDGSTQTATISNPLNQSNLTQEWTVSAWINITDKVSQVLISGLNNGIHVCYGQGNNSLLYLNDGVGTNDYYTYGGDLGGIGWTYATFRFKNSNGNRTIYRNITDITTSGPNTSSTPRGQLSTFTIGSGLQGNISMIQMYNRYISNTELSQNFNALKGRFVL